VGFGGLLRQLREEAGLTQEELAEAARVSRRAVSDLERGINRTARKDTAVLLAGALGLAGQVSELFVAAARGRAPAGAVLAAKNAEGMSAFLFTDIEGSTALLQRIGGPGMRGCWRIITR
jgi:transcriptional regulator with XRE-family HTH domain